MMSTDRGEQTLRIGLEEDLEDPALRGARSLETLVGAMEKVDAADKKAGAGTATEKALGRLGDAAKKTAGGYAAAMQQIETATEKLSGSDRAIAKLETKLATAQEKLAAARAATVDDARGGIDDEIAKLETKLRAAQEKLAAVQAGSVDERAVAAYEKQADVVAGLERKLNDAKEALVVMGQARVTPADLAKAERQVDALAAKLDAAKEKLDALSSGTGAKVDLAAVEDARAAVEEIEANIEQKRVEATEAVAQAEVEKDEAVIAAMAAVKAADDELFAQQMAHVREQEKAWKEAQEEKSKAAVKAADKIADAEAESFQGVRDRHFAATQSAHGAESGFGKMLQWIGSNVSEKFAGSISEGATNLVQGVEQLGPVGQGLLRAAGGLAGAAATWAAVVGALLAAAAAIAAKLLVSGAKLAIDMSSARESATAALNALTGGKGDQAYTVAVKLAADLNLDKGEAVERVKALLVAGFSTEEVPLVVTAVANFQAVKGADKANELNQKLVQMMAKGKFDVEGLGETGIQTELVYKKLAEQMGISIDQARAKVKMGQVEMKDGVKAVAAAVDQLTGGAGAKAAQSVGGLLNKLQIQFESLFDKVDLTPIKNFLANISKVLDGPAGAKLKTAITDLFGNLFKALFGDLGDADAAEKMAQFVQQTADDIHALAAAVKEATPLIRAMVDALLQMTEATKGLGEGFQPGGFRMPEGGLDPAKLYGSGAAPANDNARTNGVDLGQAFVDGYIARITAGSDPAFQAAMQLARSAAAGVQAGQESHSPSKVTAALADDFNAGFVDTITGGAADAHDAGADIARAAVGGAGSAGAPDGAGGGGAVTIGSISVVIQGGPAGAAASGGASTADIEAAVERGVRAAVRQIRREAA